MVEQPLQVLIAAPLLQHGLRLATAESCTGGLLGHLLTNVPGSSSYYVGGVIAYANEIKERLLGVQRETLETHGAVSRETVLEMARGVREAFSADIGISVSGIAGPSGGTPEKPVGTTWIGLSVSGTDVGRSFLFEGDRLQIKERAAQAALLILLDYLMASFGQ